MEVTWSDLNLMNLIEMNIWWKLAQLIDNCRKYLVFLVKFEHIFKGGIYRDFSDHPTLMLNISRTDKDIQFFLKAAESW